MVLWITYNRVAFNAGLVLLAALLVSPKETWTEVQTNTAQWQFLENATIYLNMAIEALQNLDRGNRVVQRISDYLSQLAVAVLSLRESFQRSCPMPNPTACKLIDKC